jgi:hypothetical protein
MREQAASQNAPPRHDALTPLPKSQYNVPAGAFSGIRNLLKERIKQETSDAAVRIHVSRLPAEVRKTLRL